MVAAGSVLAARRLEVALERVAFVLVWKKCNSFYETVLRFIGRELKGDTKLNKTDRL